MMGGGACLISFINAAKLCPRANSLCYSGDLLAHMGVSKSHGFAAVIVYSVYEEKQLK